MHFSKSWAIALASIVLAYSSVASAQATRTWVSGVGDDVNPCSRTAPCKTFAGAIGKTAANGEIDALDPGGYGTLTITKPITIDGGEWGSVLNSGGVNGFVINLATSGQVVLRNLRINGTGTTAGLDAIRIAPGSAAGSVIIDNVVAERQSGTCVNAEAAAAFVVVIRNSRLFNCTTGVAAAPGGGAALTLTLEGSLVAGNSVAGISASGGSTLVRLSDTTVLDNGVGLSSAGGAAIASFNNNRLRGNGTDGAPTITYYQR